jgi:hypothetical protein
MRSAYAAGMGAVGEVEPATLPSRWVRFLRSMPQENIPWNRYEAMLEKFAAGYYEASGIRLSSEVWLPTRKSVAAVIMVMNEEQVIDGVIDEVQRLPFHEIIVVVNGSTDRTFEKVRRFHNVIIEHYSAPLGHDVGRALGTRLSTADIVLYLDGDFPVLAEQMLPFIYAVERGVDVALNDIDPYIGVFSCQDHVTRAKCFLNRVLSRTDLSANSMTAVPHALSRRAIEEIGISRIAVPPLAQAQAIMKGLVVQAADSVDVIHKNKVREHNVGEGNPVANMILGDHAEALAAVLGVRGDRMQYPDHVRRRSAIGGSDEWNESV